MKTIASGYVLSPRLFRFVGLATLLLFRKPPNEFWSWVAERALLLGFHELLLLCFVCIDAMPIGEFVDLLVFSVSFCDKTTAIGSLTRIVNAIVMSVNQTPPLDVNFKN